MSETDLITLSNVSKHYSVDNQAGVAGIDLSIKKGEFVSVIGESGSGKSTLLKLIYGTLAPNSGKVAFNGEAVLGPHEKLIPGDERMRMVTQDFSLNLYAKVYDNISGALSNEDVKAKEQKTWEMMEFLGIEKLADKRIVELSGGEQQRVAISRAIITEPEVLLLDEPFSQIDAVLKVQLRADLKRLSSFLGITIILVSHDPADGLSLADQLVILKDGKMIESGKPAEIYNDPAHAYTARLLGNATVLNAEDAARIGLKTRKSEIAFYPEWAGLRNSWGSKTFTVKDIFFKGFYEELLLERNNVQIRAVNTDPGAYEKGGQTGVVVERYLEFE